jgi:RHS repeat-associated protein
VERDDEIKRAGESYDYGFRMLDPRVGRFLSVDPLTAEYPWYSPYQFAGNMPTAAIDRDGLEPSFVNVPYNDGSGPEDPAPKSSSRAAKPGSENDKEGCDSTYIQRCASCHPGKERVGDTDGWDCLASSSGAVDN